MDFTSNPKSLVGLLSMVAFGLVQAASPPAGSVTIGSIGVLGSGCPSGGTVSVSGTSFTINVSPFIARSGPGTSPSDARKNCIASIPVSYPAGWQLSIIDSNSNGHAFLPSAGQTGSTNVVTWFTGGLDTTFSKSFAGPLDADYTFTASGPGTWTPCGATSTILNINTDVRVTTASPTVAKNITAKPFVGQMDIVGATNWRQC